MGVIKFIDYINIKYEHSFIRNIEKENSLDASNKVISKIFICNNCGLFWNIYGPHDPKLFDNGFFFDEEYYEIYLNLDLDDYNYIEYLNLTCKEQIIKNLLE